MARRTSEASNKSAGSQNNEDQSETRTASKASQRKASEKQKKGIWRSKNEAQDDERRKAGEEGKKREKSDQVVGETPDSRSSSSSWAPPWSPALIQGSFRKQNRKVHDAGGDTVTMERWHMAEAIRFVEAGRKAGGRERDVPLPTQAVPC
ncbi:hypothetical protein J3F84DRAFT_361762 [Trichoderma pleuroticola]